MQAEYFYNTHTKRIVSANPAMIEYAKTKHHLLPCDVNGKTLKADGDDSGDGTAQLRDEIVELQTENELLKEELRELRGESGQKPAGEEEGEQFEPDPEAPRDGDGPTKVDILADKIGELEDGNPGHFTTTGLPRTEILEVLSGYENVTSKERDAAWEQYNS